MKKALQVRLCLLFSLFCVLFSGFLALASSSLAFEQIEAGLEYPVAMGTMAQNFNSNIGFNASVYFDRLLDPAIPNFISVAYENFGMKSDVNSVFRVIPIMAGFDLVGKVFKDLNTTFGVAAGMAFGYMSVSNQSTYNVNEYFSAQVRMGLEYLAGDSFTILLRSPVNLLVGRRPLAYTAFDLGVKFKL